MFKGQWGLSRFFSGNQGSGEYGSTNMNSIIMFIIIISSSSNSSISVIIIIIIISSSSSRSVLMSL